MAIPSLLPERGLLRVSGAAAEDFLQNLLTQDVAALAEGKLVYACLLTPQGRFLHDMFVFRDGADFMLDIDRPRKDDLLRRLKMFRLRAKVDFAEEAGHVYAGEVGEGERSYPDPRLPALGWRSYTARELPAAESYHDRRIHLGVPDGSADLRPDIDYVADVNLDRLHAVSWTKGCFVGQEVTARVENRALIKRRLFIVAGEGLVSGQALLQEGRAVGELRSVNRAGSEGLAVLRLDAVPEGVRARLPEWL